MQSFQNLIKTVEETGQTITATRDLERKTEQLEAHSGALNMERVVSDLQQIRAENAALVKSKRGA